MENTDSGPTAGRLLDSVYFRGGPGSRRPQDSVNFSVSHFQGTQASFHLSQVCSKTTADFKLLKA